MAVSPREKKLLIVAGAVVVFAAAMFLLRSGGPDEEPLPVAAPPPAATTTPSPTPTPEPTEEPVDEPDLVFSGRDPFQPLSVPVPVPNTNAPAPAVSPAGSPPSGPGQGSSTTIDGHTVVLIDVFDEDGTDMAQVEVDGTVYTVQEGETFGGSYRLVQVAGTCADFLYGDQSFTLCEASNK